MTLTVDLANRCSQAETSYGCLPLKQVLKTMGVSTLSFPNSCVS